MRRTRPPEPAPPPALEAPAEAPAWRGVGDGRPALPDGEPLLPRWFVISMLVLVPIGLVLIAVLLAWVFLFDEGTSIDAASRRPPGNAVVTHERGSAVLNQDPATEPGPGCATTITLTGDESARSAARRAIGATCQLLQQEGFSTARAGLDRWASSGGVLRMGVFELSGVDGSSRSEDGRLVVELNAKFQYEPGDRAAPVIVHELVHFARGMPGRPVTAPAELEAMTLQKAACDRLVMGANPPRACMDADELLTDPQPLARLAAAGFPPS